MENEQNKLAYYDISTDKIHGCEPGTLSYYHEEGHQHWARQGKEQMIQQTQWVLLLVFLPLAVGMTENLYLFIASLLPLILFLVSEIHAWIFAFNKWGKNGTF